MTAVLLLLALVMAGALLLAVALGRAAALGDQQLRDAAARKRAELDKENPPWSTDT